MSVSLVPTVILSRQPIYEGPELENDRVAGFELRTARMLGKYSLSNPLLNSLSNPSLGDTRQGLYC